MKKYTLEWVLSSRQVRLTRATKPKPFPGKYPTRIAWQGLLTNGKKVSYIGKPTRKAIEEYHRLRDSYMLTRFWSIEFDRNGTIARDKTIFPKDRDRPCDTVELRRTYHLFSTDANRFFRHNGEWRVLLQGAKRCVMFWPDNVTFHPEMCRTYGYTIAEGQPIRLVAAPAVEPPENPLAPQPPPNPRTLPQYAGLQRLANQRLANQYMPMPVPIIWDEFNGQ